MYYKQIGGTFPELASNLHDFKAVELITTGTKISKNLIDAIRHRTAKYVDDPYKDRIHIVTDKCYANEHGAHYFVELRDIQSNEEALSLLRRVYA